jgi:hypothetical protein
MQYSQDNSKTAFDNIDAVKEDRYRMIAKSMEGWGQKYIIVQSAGIGEFSRYPEYSQRAWKPFGRKKDGYAWQENQVIKKGVIGAYKHDDTRKSVVPVERASYDASKPEMYAMIRAVILNPYGPARLSTLL